MKTRTSAVVRLVAIAVMVASWIAVAAAPAAAQREPDHLTRAEQVREMVLKQREKVHAQIDALMSGEKGASQPRQVEPAAEGDAAEEESDPEGGEGEVDEGEGDEAEDAEGEGAEGEDGEAEDGEAEDGEGEADEEDVLELPETGAGQPRGAGSPLSALMVVLGALAAIGLGGRRRFN